MGTDTRPNLALVIRLIPKYGEGRAETFYVGASGNESSVCELRTSGDVDLSKKIKAAISDAANAGVINVIFDLVNQRFINSTGLGVLVNLYHEINRNGGRVVIANPNSTITGILELTQLKGIFVLAGSIEEAVQYLLSMDGTCST